MEKLNCEATFCDGWIELYPDYNSAVEAARKLTLTSTLEEAYEGVGHKCFILNKRYAQDAEGAETDEEVVPLVVLLTATPRVIHGQAVERGDFISSDNLPKALSHI